MEDLYSSEEELMGADGGRPRLAILNTIQGSSLMSLVLEETTDSFLVAFPAKLVQNEEGDTEVDPYLPVPYARFMKTGILFITPLFGTFEYLYLEYLLTVGIEEYPEAVSEDGVKALLDRLAEVNEAREDSLEEDDLLMEDPLMHDDPISDTSEVAEYLTNLNNKYKH